ncbi:MAG TPA: hypothetical protein VE462_08345 [Propionibacteriaceae bacterium]|jgi:hypothetical protein|nr:hypothetical protein [Propionibacteriaceae bacterium]
MIKPSAASEGATEELQRVQRAEKVSELLYGAVVSASILAISSLHGPTSERVALATLGGCITYWLAHVYVDAIGGRFRDPEHSAHARLRKALIGNTEILVGSLPPIIVFVLGQLLGLGISGSAWLALWFTVAMLTGTAAYAAHLAGVRGVDLAVETLAAGVLGLLVIGLKYVLH